MVEDFNAFFSKLNIFLDLLNAIIIRLVKLFDLIFLILSLILQIPDLVLQLFNFPIPYLLIRSMSRFDGKLWNLSAVINIGLDILKTKFTFWLLVFCLIADYFFFSIATHEWLKNILNNIKLINQQHINYKFFH
jgi:hypothetical protein